jgi:hypothetical protein
MEGKVGGSLNLCICVFIETSWGILGWGLRNMDYGLWDSEMRTITHRRCYERTEPVSVSHEGLVPQSLGFFLVRRAVAKTDPSTPVTTT